MLRKNLFRYINILHFNKPKANRWTHDITVGFSQKWNSNVKKNIISFILLTGPFGWHHYKQLFWLRKISIGSVRAFLHSLSNSWSIFFLLGDVAGQSGQGTHKNLNGICLHFVTHTVDLLHVGEDHLGIDSVVADHGVHVVGRQEVGDAGVTSKNKLNIVYSII